MGRSSCFDYFDRGDIKDDQYFLNDFGEVVLGDFGTAWRMVDEDGVQLRLGSRDELLERRAGVGQYKAPEVRGRTRVGGQSLREVYSKAGGFGLWHQAVSFLDRFEIILYRAKYACTCRGVCLYKPFRCVLQRGFADLSQNKPFRCVLCFLQSFSRVLLPEL